jgi:hypothetical protein
MKVYSSLFSGSGQPFEVGEVYSVYLECRDESDWSGTIKIGVTRKNPLDFEGKQLPKHSCPDLSSRDGVWIKKVKDGLLRCGTNRYSQA